MFKKFNKKNMTIFFILIYIVGLIIFLIGNSLIFDLINKNYIKQNTAIVGALSDEKFMDLGNSVIPIITKGYNEEQLKKGEKILKSYSYNKLTKEINGYLSDSYKVSIILIIVIWTILIGGIYLYVSKFYNYVFNYVDKLTVKAENVVEGRFSKGENIKLEDEKLSKLENQFYLMEKRIEKSLIDLKSEKKNLKDVIDDISHQLKTPLAALIMYNEILSDSEDWEEIKYFNQLTKEQLARMEWLIMTLLKYAKLECNAVVYNRKEKNLKKTIESAIEALKFKAESKNQKIIFHCKKEIDFFHDRKWLEEALVNIIKNALEHSEAGESVEIKLSDSELFASIEIKDFGEGIDKEEIKHIFKRFYKGKNSTNPESIGIGLALSKSIIEGNNGTIKVQSKIGQGTVFKINFLKR